MASWACTSIGRRKPSCATVWEITGASFWRRRSKVRLNLVCQKALCARRQPEVQQGCPPAFAGNVCKCWGRAMRWHAVFRDRAVLQDAQSDSWVWCPAQWCLERQIPLWSLEELLVENQAASSHLPHNIGAQMVRAIQAQISCVKLGVGDSKDPVVRGLLAAWGVATDADKWKAASKDRLGDGFVWCHAAMFCCYFCCYCPQPC